MKNRICKECGVKKKLIYFSKRRLHKDGINVVCKECKIKQYKEVSKKWRENNVEKIKEYNKKRYRALKKAHKKKPSHNRKNILGKKFGKLTVIKFSKSKIVGKIKSNKKSFWECLCDCGNLCEVVASNLNNGHTTSCGCLSHGKGEKGHNWQGGLTKKSKIIRGSIEYSLWRESVFSRDNWTCQKNGIKGGRLHAHHIKNFAQYPELRLSIDNGITLSNKEHRKFHKIYGKKDNAMEQLEEFIKTKVLLI